ncbi:unnamed protein product [Arabis nemorensis]|uniref:Uncharacterized protein n=1 Tax=Arabis nemorensis TaxID=586526 RepID=A0A565CT65_9BRAS|nr:unnamed protein product [Arabis nemorensis]
MLEESKSRYESTSDSIDDELSGDMQDSTKTPKDPVASSSRSDSGAEDPKLKNKAMADGDEMSCVGDKFEDKQKIEEAFYDVKAELSEFEDMMDRFLIISLGCGIAALSSHPYTVHAANSPLQWTRIVQTLLVGLANPFYQIKTGKRRQQSSIECIFGFVAFLVQEFLQGRIMPIVKICSASDQSIGSKPEAVERHEKKEQEAIKESGDPPLHNDIVEESFKISASVSAELKRESKKKQKS